MTDERAVQVVIGASLQSSFRTVFRDANREVTAFSRALDQLGARRSNAGLSGVRDQTLAVVRNMTSLRGEVRQIGRALSTLQNQMARTATATRDLSAAMRTASSSTAGMSRSARTASDNLRAAAEASRMYASALRQQAGAERAAGQAAGSTRARRSSGGGGGVGSALSVVEGSSNAYTHTMRREPPMLEGFVRGGEVVLGGGGRGVSNAYAHTYPGQRALPGGGAMGYLPPPPGGGAGGGGSSGGGRWSNPFGWGRGGGSGGGGGGGGHGGGGGGGHGGPGSTAGHAALHALVGAGSMAYVGGHAIRSIWEESAGYQHEINMRKMQGWNKEEIDEAVEQARRVSRAVGTVTERENLATLGHLSFALGNRKEAMDSLMAAQTMTATLKAVNPNINGEANAYGAIKAIEQMNHAHNEAEISSWMKAMTGSMVASGGKVTGEMFQQFVSRSAGAAQFYSQDFLTQIAPTMMQEMGGGQAGNALGMMRSALVGGRMTQSAARALSDLHLLDPASGGGAVTFRNRNGFLGRLHTRGLNMHMGSVANTRATVVDPELFQRDPEAWAIKHLLPAVKGRSPEQIGQFLSQAFSNRSAERAASILILQAARITKDQGLIKAAQTTLDQLGGDPTVALDKVIAQWRNLEKAIGAPFMAPATHGLNTLAIALGNLSETSPATIERLTTIGTAMVGLPALAWGASVAFKAMSAGLGSLRATVMNPWMLGIAAAGYLIYKNWDWVKGFASTALPGLERGLNRIGNAFDFVTGAAESTLRFFVVIPKESEKAEDAFHRGAQMGEKFATVLELVVPAATTLFLTRGVSRIVSGLGQIGGAAGGAGRGLSGVLGTLGRIVALAETLHLLDKNEGSAGNSRFGQWMNEHVPGAAQLDDWLNRKTNGAVGTPLTDPRYSWNQPGAQSDNQFSDAQKDALRRNAPVTPGPGPGEDGPGFIPMAYKSSQGAAGHLTAGERVLTASVYAGVLAALEDYSGRSTTKAYGGSGFTLASFGDGDLGGGGGGGSALGGAQRYLRSLGRGGRGGVYGGGSDAGGTAGSLAGGVGARGNRLMSKLMSMGWSREAAAAVAGNAQQESGVRSDGPLGDTARFGFGDDAAHGMFQWRGQRFRNLKAFAASKGTDWKDFDTQVEFFNKEARGSYGADAWMGSNNVALANRGMKHFEGYGDNSLGTRLANARQFLGGGSGGLQPGATGSGNNAVDIAMGLRGAGASASARALGHKMSNGQWCADFVNGALEKAGMQGSGSSMASSFRKWGVAVPGGINGVQKGDVLTEDHGGGRGHAMMATGNVRRDRNGNVTGVEVISGNHGNKVGTAWETPGEIASIRRAAQSSEAIKQAAGRAGGRGGVHINAPITIHPAPGQSEDAIGQSAARHIHDQDRMAAAENRSSTFDWVG